MALQVAHFTYTGDGNDDRSIDIGVSWTPELVIVKADTAELMVFKTSSMGANVSCAFGVSGAYGNQIQDIGAGTIEVGTHARVNSNTVNYRGIAIRDDDSEHLVVGSYSGNATDDRDITIGGSMGVPDFVCVRAGSGTRECRFSSTSMTSGNSCGMAGQEATNQIQSLSSGQFQVGTHDEVNASSVTYYWFALAEESGVLAEVGYSGDGNDDRNLTGFGLDPDAFVFIKRRNGFADSYVRMVDHSGDDSQQWNGADTTNGIQGFITDGVQLGTNFRVNSSVGTYIALAINIAAVSGVASPSWTGAPGGWW